MKSTSRTARAGQSTKSRVLDDGEPAYGIFMIPEEECVVPDLGLAAGLDQAGYQVNLQLVCQRSQLLVIGSRRDFFADGTRWTSLKAMTSGHFVQKFNTPAPLVLWAKSLVCIAK